MLIIPDFVTRLLTTNKVEYHVEDVKMPRAVSGYTYRIYPTNLSQFRFAFSASVEHLCSWARENGANAFVVYTEQPTPYSGPHHGPWRKYKNRENDYIVFVLTEPVNMTLKIKRLLPGHIYDHTNQPAWSDDT